MNVRLAALSALAALAGAGAVLAQEANGPTLTLTGQIVSTGNTSLVVRTDDGRESPPLIVTTTTQVTPGLGLGRRVTVYYHSVGDRQVADRVVAAGAFAQPPAGSGPAPQPPTGGGGPHAETGGDTES